MYASLHCNQVVYIFLLEYGNAFLVTYTVETFSVFKKPFLKNSLTTR